MRFKNRIALFNTLAAAITMLVVFTIMYVAVDITTFRHLDNTIRAEKEEIFAQIERGDSIYLSLNAEWEEREHNQAEVNPILMQIVNNKGRLVFHSRNLQNDHLLFANSLTSEFFFNVMLNGKRIRQGQFPIKNDAGKLLGQLDIGVSQVESALILSNLRITFFVAFPVMLFIFYFVTSLAASRSIAPVKQLIHFARNMDFNHINKRVPLPSHRDEIHMLTTTINDLLERIEIGLNREKQITADISHELRTPLTSIRGTLEVMIRKPREPHHYEEKVHQVIHEVDSMNHTIDQLLHLARIDSGNLSVLKTPLQLHDLLQKLKNRWLPRMHEKNMSVHIDTTTTDVVVSADYGLLEIMLGNFLSNAFKYGKKNGSVVFRWDNNTKKLSIADDGPGISSEHLPYIFDRFYKTDISGKISTQSIGLGLYIVKTLANFQGISVQVESSVDKGTEFSLLFNS